MELFGPNPLPVIFKFSHISRVLVYYGRLHNWKVLMETLSKGTKQLWEDNFDAFVKWGEHYKAQLWLMIESRKLDSFISKLDYNYKWISNSSTYFDNFCNPISKIFEAWSSDKVILVYVEYQRENNAIIWMNSIKFEYLFKFMICFEEEESNIFPVIKCPKFKHKFNSSLSSISKADQIHKILLNNWILIAKSDGEIKYEKNRKPCLQFRSSSIKKHQKMQNKKLTLKV